MCGITGILSCDPSNIYLERLKKMTDSVAHRGPDGEGYWMNPDGEVGFGHRRLSVIDLSESAAQPMHYLGKYTCIHNGEIYNYTELKQVLIARGYFFRTASDTEVLIAAYHCYGVECLSHFDGMFAFAIWDELEKTLFCARDRMGEKPFYYSFFENAFVFGSEAKVLWAAGLPKKVNEPMLLNFLSAGHVNTPLDLTISFYQQVFILPPAHYLRLSMPDLELSLHAYWDADKESMLKISEKEAEEKISHLFGQSLTRRLRSDVETGSTLSGGLDSSSIAAAIHGTGKFRQKTFSAVFPGYEKDESSYIEKVAARFDLANFSITPKVDELIGDFEKLCHYQEIPFTSSSIYLQYRVFGLAKEHGTKVLLDGQGADELFAGYSKYIHWYLQELFRKNPLNFLSEKRALNRNRIPYHWSWRNYLAAWFPAQAAIQLEKREARKIAGNPDINPEYKDQFFDRPSIYKPLVMKLNDQLYFNCFRQGLQDLLHYADRNSMAHGCEIRLPFLNHELIQFLFSLASSLKIHNGWTKYILRKTMEDQLPSEIVWRKDKIGFEPPQKTWMSDPQLQDYVQEGRKILVGEKILKKEVLNKKNQPMDAHAADNFDWRYLVTAKCIF